MAKLISSKNEYKNWFFYKTLSIYPGNIFLSDIFFDKNNKLKKDFFYNKNMIRDIIKKSNNNKFYILIACIIITIENKPIKIC
jgi:hypothetical protein